MNNKQNRIESIDWLRAILAISIVIYHLISWTNFNFNSSHILSRIAIGGVSMFFIISGLCLSIIYEKININNSEIFQFYYSRILRIWPLFWLVAILTLILSHLNNTKIDQSIPSIVLNFTTLFSLFSSTKTFVTGSWTIGNEIVFYLFTPFILVTYRYKKIIGNIIFLISLFIGIYFSMFKLDSSKNLDDQWTFFIHPLNNLFLFILGIAMYNNFKKTNLHPIIIYSILIFSSLIFCFLPLGGDNINIVTGLGRSIFIILYFLIVFSVYKFPLKSNEINLKFIEKIGVATYGIYLLHPIIKGYSMYFIRLFIAKNINYNHPIINIIIIITTIILSILSYKYIEIKIIKIGKSVFKGKLKF